VFGRETTADWELGAKTSWLDHALTLNLTFYRMDINGFQDRPFDGTSFTVRNAGNLRNQGFEFDGIARPLANFSVFANVAYLDSEFTDYPAAPGLPGTPNIAQDLKESRRPTRRSGPDVSVSTGPANLRTDSAGTSTPTCRSRRSSTAVSRTTPIRRPSSTAMRWSERERASTPRAIVGRSPSSPTTCSTSNMRSGTFISSWVGRWDS
jgi:outer membrane receptor protein involved in Fe transport